MFRLPTTTSAGFTLPGQVDAELLQLFGVVAFLQQVPFLAAFGNVALLRADLVARRDRKSTRLNSSHSQISYAVFCLKKKTTTTSHYLHTAIVYTLITLSS